MELRILPASERQRWTSFATAHPLGHFMQSWEWAEVKATQGWAPHFLTVEEGGVIIAGTLVQGKRLPLLGKQLFYSPRGPLFEPQRREAMELLVRGVRELARREGAVFWRIDPYVNRGDGGATPETMLGYGFREVPLEWSYWNASKYLMILDTTGTEEEVFSRINSRDRGKVRSPLRNGVRIETGGPDDLPDFFETMIKTAEKKSIPVRDLAHYRALYTEFLAHDMIRLFLARTDEGVVSAGMSVKYGDKAWLLYLGSTYGVKYANWALQWEMVRWAVESGCRRYDFLGTATTYPPKESDKGYGVYRFKKSYGSELTVMLGYFDQVFQPALYRLMTFAERKLPAFETLFLEKMNIFSLLNKRKDER